MPRILSVETVTLRRAVRILPVVLAAKARVRRCAAMWLGGTVPDSGVAVSHLSLPFRVSTASFQLSVVCRTMLSVDWSANQILPEERAGKKLRRWNSFLLSLSQAVKAMRQQSRPPRSFLYMVWVLLGLKNRLVLDWGFLGGFGAAASPRVEQSRGGVGRRGRRGLGVRPDGALGEALAVRWAFSTNRCSRNRPSAFRSGGRRRARKPWRGWRS